MRGARGALLLVLVWGVLVMPAGASWGQAGEVTNVAPPAVLGTPRFDRPATADPGTWAPEPESTSYQWLVDGGPVAGATDPSYTPRLGDIGHDLSVRVTATVTGLSPGTRTSDPKVVRRGLFRDPAVRVDGVPRFGRTLSLDSFRATPAPQSRSLSWVRDGGPIAGQTR